ncbi:hypothetical protein A2U01_0045596, partial [Trifolium medium]|nr:hypothetical protein [Trifolium medium]
MAPSSPINTASQSPSTAENDLQ